MTENKPISPDEINPVDYYNDNGYQDAIAMLLKVGPMKQNSPNSLTYVVNKADNKLKMFIYEDGYFVVKENNKLELKIGDKYSLFAFVQKLVFKNCFHTTLGHVVYKIMNNDIPYIRVGISYYKKITIVDRNGIKRDNLERWDKQTITDDHGKVLLKEVSTYNAFSLVPDNKNFKPVVDGNYNLYSPFPHIPAELTDYEKKGDLSWYWIRTLLEHIFGEQYELGIMYLKVLYDNPKQKLPILVLVSEERSTGKTTFIDLLELLFGANSVIINPQDIGSNFNSSYANKNVIMIEESKFDSKQTLEKIKNLATQKKILVNTKYLSPYSMPFYGHLIITSNDESKFSKVDESEIRYWVRQIPTLEGKSNHNILADMKKEISYFLRFLEEEPEVDLSKSRMVFTPEEIKTDALLRVKKESKTSLYKDLQIMFEEYMLENITVELIKFTLTDIKDKWFKFNHQIDLAYLKNVFAKEFKLKPKMQRYIPFETIERSISEKKKSGQAYTIVNKYYNTDIDE